MQTVKLSERAKATVGCRASGDGLLDSKLSDLRPLPEPLRCYLITSLLASSFRDGFPFTMRALAPLATLSCVGCQTLLFAGRRSTDRAFLLLQNLFCAQHLPNYAGTSAIYAVCKIDAALQSLGLDSVEERKAHIGKVALTVHWVHLDAGTLLCAVQA